MPSLQYQSFGLLFVAAVFVSTCFVAFNNYVETARNRKVTVLPNFETGANEFKLLAFGDASSTEEDVAETPTGERLEASDTFNQRQKKLRKMFKPVLSENEREMYRKCMAGCVELFKNAGLSYFLYGGSLIGWYRHNGSIIPWDDDVDVALLPTIKEAGRNITHYKNLMTLEAKKKGFVEKYGDFSIVANGNIQLKCFPRGKNNSNKIAGYKWRWPFLDIHFMRVFSKSPRRRIDNLFDTKVVDVLVRDPKEVDFEYPLDWIIPLKEGQFEGINIYLPKRVERVLNLNYNMRECQGMWYNHRLEEVAVEWEHVFRANCSELVDFVNFTRLDVIYGT